MEKPLKTVYDRKKDILWPIIKIMIIAFAILFILFGLSLFFAFVFSVLWLIPAAICAAPLYILVRKGF